MWALRHCLNDAMSCDFLTIGSNAFQGLLLKYVMLTLTGLFQIDALTDWTLCYEQSLILLMLHCATKG